MKVRGSPQHDVGKLGNMNKLTLPKFRRSMKSDKHDSAKPVQVSIPQKDAIAIEPPKKVRICPHNHNVTRMRRPGEVYMTYANKMIVLNRSLKPYTTMLRPPTLTCTSPSPPATSFTW